MPQEGVAAGDLRDVPSAEFTEAMAVVSGGRPRHATRLSCSTLPGSDDQATTTVARQHLLAYCVKLLLRYRRGFLLD